MANPKRKQSKRRSRLRRAANQFRAPKLVKDGESGALRRSHRVDPTSGKYRGRQVLDAGA
ncbi:50S ribosomal protein L32 [Opitutia bacterium]|jgi:large subunit ribosomal protein L32|nr:MAG: 50S ribosomal protein L32 [Opitutae bacterium AMD-G1]GBL23831.1 50S ribosomal protein L32 [Opitutae bacterium]